MRVKLEPGRAQGCPPSSVLYLLLGLRQDQPPQHDDLSRPETPGKGA